MVEAGGEVRGGVRVRNIGLTDRLSGSDRVCYRGRPGRVERPSEVTCRVWAGGQGAAGRGGGGESAGGRWRYQSSGCVMGTCIHHMRGGMGSGGTYTRPEEHQSGEEDEVDILLFLEAGIWEW